MTNDKITPKEGKKEVMDTNKFQPPLKTKSREIKIIRMLQTDLDGSKKFEHGIIKIKGVSWAYARALRKHLGFENKRISEFTEDELNKIKEALKDPQSIGIPDWFCNRRFDPTTGKTMHILSSDLILLGKLDVKRLKSARTYRGIRHSYNYKVRGQRTRSRGANVRGRVGGSVGVVRKKTIPQKSAK